MTKKRVTKETNTKKVFDLDSFKKQNNMDNTIKEKELSWIPLSDAFYDATKVPGIARGFFTSFRGFSNTGKSTAMYEAVVGAQKIGDLSVIIDTETNWNWEHAKNIGVEFEEVVNEDTGEIIDYKGDFLFFQSKDLVKRYECFDYSNGKESSKPLRNEPIIEDIARLMDDLLEAQSNGDLPRNLMFLWDSVGSINGFKSVMSKSNNNQWNAGSIGTAFKALTNYKIPSSRREDSEYTNTFAVVQKIWLDNENKVVKHKGGEAFYYAPRMIFHYGGILSHSTKLLKATSGGETYQFGIETRISCVKNQVNGVEEKGVIASTPHGYWNPNKIDEYKKEYRSYILERLNTPLEDFNIEYEEQKFSKEDLNA
jgi:hypothetical protein